jgi:hypothetical protein
MEMLLWEVTEVAKEAAVEICSLGGDSQRLAHANDKAFGARSILAYLRWKSLGVAV